MEIEGVKKIVNRLKENRNIIGYVHDQDSKTSNYFRDNWNITEFIDPNHANKSFSGKFSNYNKGKIKNVKKGIFKKIQKDIQKYRQFLIRSNFMAEERVLHWLNAAEHYSGNHKNCLHEPYQNRTEEISHLSKWALNITDEKLNALRIFLNDTIQYVEKVDIRYNTQNNEGFHNLKRILDPKTLSWGGSFEARMAIAVLRLNEPDLYIELLSKAIGLGTHAVSASSALVNFIKMRNIKKKKNKKQIEHQKKLMWVNRRKQQRDDNNGNSGYDFGHGKF